MVRWVYIASIDQSLNVGHLEGDMTSGEAYFFNPGNFQSGMTAKECCLAAFPAAGEIAPSIQREDLGAYSVHHRRYTEYFHFMAKEELKNKSFFIYEEQIQ